MVIDLVALRLGGWVQIQSTQYPYRRDNKGSRVYTDEFYRRYLHPP